MENLYTVSTELKHSGILGMHWGKRNGPPYPLKDSAKSSEEKKYEDMNDDEKKEHRRNIVQTATPQKVLSNIDKLTTDELREAVNRLDMEKRLKDLTPKEVSRGKKALERYAEVTGLFEKGFNNTNKIITDFQRFDKLINGNKDKKDKGKKKK